LFKVSRETVRLELKAAGYVWKRAKLKGRDDDPERARRLARIRLLFENQRPDELILFADELDIDLLPKVGYQWMLKGTQLEIRTPGKNQKHYLAAALNPETGQTYYVLGPKKNNVLFRELLNHLLRSSAFSAMFTTNAHATILGSICEPWSWTWKNIWRKT